MRKFNKGDIVEIIDGPYKGVIGKIDDIIEFDPGVVGLYLIKTKEGSTIKIIDADQLRLVGGNTEPEPEEVTEDTITISREDLIDAVTKVCTSKDLFDSFSDPMCSLFVSMSGMAIGKRLEKVLFDKEV